MITKKFLVPLVSHNDDFNIQSLETTLDVQINNEVRDAENLTKILDNIYIAVFKKVIEYNKIHNYVVHIYEYVLDADITIDNTLFIQFLLEIGMLVQNYYYILRRKVVSEDCCTLFGLDFIEINYPVFNEPDLLDLTSFIHKLKERNIELNATINDLIFGYLYIHKTDTNYDLTIDNKSQAILDFIFNYENKNIFDNFFSTDCETFDVEKFYFENIDKKLFIEKCFANNLTHIQKQIITQSKSHYYIDLHFHYTIVNPQFESLFIETSMIDDQHTYSVIHKLMDYNEEQAEHIFKKLILKHKELKYKNMFFEKCTRIDPEYIDICIIYMDNVKKLEHELFINIVSSRYFNYFARNLMVYKESILRLSTSKLDHKTIENIVENMFNDVKYGCEKTYFRMIFFLKSFEEFKPKIAAHFIRLFTNTYENRTCKCKNNTSEDTVSNLVSTMSNISISNLKENTSMFQLINYLRDESDIHDHIPKFIESDFSCFVENCFDSKNFNIDVMLYKVFEYLQSNQNCISASNLLTSYLQNFENSKSEDYYWDTIFKKCVNNMQIYKDTVFSKVNNKTLAKHLFDNKKLIEMMQKILTQTFIDYDLLECILARFDKDNKYSSGLALKKSQIVINTSAKSFCFYGIFYQYDIPGEQGLFELQNVDSVINLTLNNGNLFIQILKEDTIDNFLVNNETNPKKIINLGIKVIRDRIKIYYNTSKYEYFIHKSKKIIIGNNFKGVLSKMIWHENSKFDKNLFDVMKDTCAYNKTILDLEKMLNFNNDAGVFVYTTVPYFFNRKIDILIKGAIMNKNVSWLENTKIRELFYDRMGSDNRLLTLFDRYISNQLQNFM